MNFASFEGAEDIAIAWARGLAPDPAQTVAEWADRHRILSSRAASEAGPYRTSRTPYLKAIMEALSPNNPAQRVVFMKSAQVGATEAGNNWIGFCIHRAPGPILAVQPTTDLTKRLSQQRIEPLIEESPDLRALVLPARSRDAGNTVLAKRFPGGQLVLTGANSAVGLRSMPARWLFLDEVDAYPGDLEGEGDPVALAEARTDSFGHRKKIFLASTPTIKGLSRIEREFELTDQRRYHVPCPHCGGLQWLKFERLRWEKGRPETAAYLCEHCEAPIAERHKTWMMDEENGADWLPTAAPDVQASAETAGVIGFHISGLTALAVREMIEGGEVFALRRRRRASDRLAAPVQIQLNEADHLDGAKFDNRPDGSRIVQGIEYDALGRRRGYWMFPDHPGDAMPVFGRRFESLRIGAEGVAHLFERQRVQNRGVPWGVPAMRALRELGDWQTAELVRKKIEASMVGFVFGADEDQQSMAPVVQDADGNRIEQFEPGLIGYVRNGKDIKFNTPASTSGIYEWNRVQQHIISAGFRVPYELMTGDLSQVNFASSRVGLHEFRRMVEAVQWQVVIPMFCQRIWDWVMEAAWTAGALPQPEIAVEWAPPRFESVNPLHDVTADLMEVRAGFSTPAQQIARRGYDPREVVEEWQKYAALFDQLGLIFDADPRRVSRAGLAQAVDATDRDPPPDER